MVIFTGLSVQNRLSPLYRQRIAMTDALLPTTDLTPVLGGIEGRVQRQVVSLRTNGYNYTADLLEFLMSERAAVAPGAEREPLEMNEHYERLLAMWDDDGNKWDLSPNDKAAIRWALDGNCVVTVASPPIAPDCRAALRALVAKLEKCKPHLNKTMVLLYGPNWDQELIAARAALAADLAPVGRQMPREPTEAMLSASLSATPEWSIKFWHAMYDAAIGATEQDEGEKT
jgi:hypothetical protein